MKVYMVAVALLAAAVAGEQVTHGTMSVVGEGTVQLPLTLARISLEVNLQGTAKQPAGEVMQTVVTNAAALASLLQRYGVAELKTSNVELESREESQPLSNGQGWTQVFVGYFARIKFSFTVPSTSSITALLTASSRITGTEIPSLTWEAAPAALKAAQRNATRLAVRDGFAKANMLAFEANVTLSKPTSISEASVSVPYPVPMRYDAGMMFKAAMAVEESSEVAIIAPGDQTIRASVPLSFRFPLD